MKKKVAILVVTCMIFSMTACGKTKETAVISESEGEEVIVESTEDEKTVLEEQNVDEEVVEEATAEVEEFAEKASVKEEEGFTIDDGMAKIDRLLEAHEMLISQRKMLEDHVQIDTEALTSTCFSLDLVTTADGKPLQTSRAIWATGINYYNHYVNENGEYYDLQEWVASQADSDSIVKSIAGMEEESNTNKVLLFEAVGIIAYIKSCESVKPIELIETSEYTISGVQSAYAIPLDCDGDTALTAVFDSEGNLLNICTPEDGSWNKYMKSFPDGQYEINMD